MKLFSPLTSRFNAFQRIFILFLLSGISPATGAPTGGTYDLYDGSGQKMGRIFCGVLPATYGSKSTTQVETTTRLNPESMSNYQFLEKDSAQIDEEGLLALRRETEDNGKKSVVTGERRDGNLFLFIEKDGKKYTTAVPLSSFDISEFEMDLPSSKFSSLKKKGETTALRVFMVELLRPVLVSRSVVDVMTAQFNGKDIPVRIVSTLVGGKATTSWYHAETGQLLQEQGDNHLMSRVSE